MSNRSVVITGTSTGIGRATALRLDGEGWRVFAGVRRQEDAASLRAEASDRLMPLLLDVTDGAAIERAAKDLEVALAGAGLDALVNNAGIGFGGPLEFADIDKMRQGFEVNVFGPVALTRALLPLIRRAGGGRIVNVSSGAGRAATPLLGPYCASKFALEALSDVLRVELRGAGIRVVVVEPGFVDTPMQTKGKSEAERTRAELPEEGERLYGAAMERLNENLERFGKRSARPEAVAAAIRRALTASRPRTRYHVGTDAKLMIPLSRILPDSVKDAIFGRLHDL